MYRCQSRVPKECIFRNHFCSWKNGILRDFSRRRKCHKRDFAGVRIGIVKYAILVEIADTIRIIYDICFGSCALGKVWRNISDRVRNDNSFGLECPFADRSQTIRNRKCIQPIVSEGVYTYRSQRGIQGYTGESIAVKRVIPNRAKSVRKGYFVQTSICKCVGTDFCNSIRNDVAFYPIARAFDKLCGTIFPTIEQNIVFIRIVANLCLVLTGECADTGEHEELLWYIRNRSRNANILYGISERIGSDRLQIVRHSNGGKRIAEVKGRIAYCAEVFP